MNIPNRFRWLRPAAMGLLAAVAVLLVASARPATSAAAAVDDGPGAVYTLSNSAAGNAVMRYSRAADGSLTFDSAVATNGLGTGSGLGSQGAITLSRDGRWLFAVNAGSNSITSFAVMPSGLRVVSVVASDGTLPISVSVQGSLLYVLNAGGAGNISGFRVGTDGSLTHLAGSARPLSVSGGSPEEIGFSPTGNVLTVTLKAANKIDTYAIGPDGLASGPVVLSAAAGDAPYGFAFDQVGHLLVSDAGAGALSSYTVAWDGTLSFVSQALDHHAAPCWVAVTQNGKFAYTANAHDGTLSGFSVAQDGSLTLLPPASGTTAVTTGTPLDLAFSVNSHFLYVFNAGTHQINAFRVGADGALTHLGDASAPSAAGGGLAAQ